MLNPMSFPSYTSAQTTDLPLSSVVHSRSVSCPVFRPVSRPVSGSVSRPVNAAPVRRGGTRQRRHRGAVYDVGREERGGGH